MGFFSKVKEKVGSVAQAASQVLGLQNLRGGLEKTRSGFVSRLKRILRTGPVIDSDLLSQIEEILITSDVGVATTDRIINKLSIRVNSEGVSDPTQILTLLRDELADIMKQSASFTSGLPYEIPKGKRPYVILVIGVNGVGKTTTIGKLANNYRLAGYSVLIGAADTFRAAANEQLEEWARRADVPIVRQQQGADPASVAFDTLKAAISRDTDIVLIDTAGRLHNKSGLMAELEKITRVMRKQREGVPDEVLLVLDATTGQNALQQAREFSKVAQVTGLVLTKLDGTAKGGIVFAIANDLNLPVKFIGIGEQITDLQPFDSDAFVDALFDEDDSSAETDTEKA